MLGATGAGAGVAVAIGSCGDREDNPEVTQTVSPEQMRSDASVLNALLDLERTAVLAYAVGRRRLTGEARAVARTLMAHERRHQRAVEDAIRDLGAHPVPPRPAAAYSDGFPPLRTTRDVLRFALDIENTQISAYGESLGSLATPRLRVMLGSILTAEAEHMSVILGQLGEPQAPQALVTGSAPT
jgi:rubrerythrin